MRIGSPGRVLLRIRLFFMGTFLERILADAAVELAAAKAARPNPEIRARLADAPPPKDFFDALDAHPFSLIAEIKQKSPSVGAMRDENVREAPGGYARSRCVAAVSILTNQLHFGMDIEQLSFKRQVLDKPILRKDFIVEEYQVREARAFGADAILLMANVLDAARLAGFYDLARELGMEALFEVHEADEIDLLPSAARIVGINSRKFQSGGGFVGPSGHSERDFSLDFSAFDLAGKLPARALRVAESGIDPAKIPWLRRVFRAGLVGTSLLRDPRGVEACLAEFEAAISGEEAE